MSSDTLLSSSIVIDSPLLEVFDYVADPEHLPEWVPFYSEIQRDHASAIRRGIAKKGDKFTAILSMFPPVANRLIPGLAFMPSMLPREIEVCVDDVVHGRRIAYRSQDAGWTTICDFEPFAGRTFLTTTHSLWSMQGLTMSYWLGPLQAVAGDLSRRVLEGLKRRLEGRAIEPSPQIFFSYRRTDARYIGGRIFDALTSEFGSGTVFRDANSLLAGRDWEGDIKQAIRACKVVVVHIGDHWEQSLQEKMDEYDGLREELEAALENVDQIRFIPVITSNEDDFSLNKRMTNVEHGIQHLGDLAPRMRKTFTAKLQVQRLREDPDFSSDLERLMRAVWNAFRDD